MVKQSTAVVTGEPVTPSWFAPYRMYPTPHQATRIAAFVIAMRMEAEREAR